MPDLVASYAIFSPAATSLDGDLQSPEPPPCLEAFFCLRLIVAWSLLVLVAFLLVDWIWSPLGRLVRPLVLVAIVFVVIRAHSHLVRVRMIAGKLSGAALASRQRWQIEVPFGGRGGGRPAGGGDPRVAWRRPCGEHAQPPADTRNGVLRRSIRSRPAGALQTRCAGWSASATGSWPWSIAATAAAVSAWSVNPRARREATGCRSMTGSIWRTSRRSPVP